MFELNPELEIVAITDIGPDKRKAMIIENIYKNPDEVRELCIKLPKQDQFELCQHHPGSRVFIEHKEIHKNLEPLFRQLCCDEQYWERPTDIQCLNRSLAALGFMCNVSNSESVTKKPLGLLPHQDYYSFQPSPFQFGAVIYLNKGEEEQGGTDMWSFCGKQTIDDNLTHLYKDYDIVKMRADVYDSVMAWRQEFMFGMKFNRCILYQADVLHAPFLTSGMFDTCDRMTQVLFF